MNTGELAKKMCREHNLDNLLATSTDEKMQYYRHRPGGTMTIDNAVDFCEQNIQGIFRLEAWAGERKQGRQKVDGSQSPFVWEIMGRSGNLNGTMNGYGQPDQGMAAVLQELKELRERMDDDEDETPAEIDPELMKTAVEGMRKFFGLSDTAAPAGAPSPTITGAPPVDGVVMTADEASELLQDLAKFKAADPNTFALLRSQLKEKVTAK